MRNSIRGTSRQPLSGLAVKGYLQIEEVKEEGLIFDRRDYYLKRVKRADSNLSPFELELMKSLFPGDLPGTLVSQLKNKFYTQLPILKKILYGELTRKGYFLSNPENVRNYYRAAGILVMVFACVGLLYLSHDRWVSGVIASFLTGIPFFLFGKVMPAKTRSGALAYMDTLGFQEFMNRAEKDKLERMKDKDLFSKYLPYAIALNVADHWAKAFEGIYQDPPELVSLSRRIRDVCSLHVCPLHELRYLQSLLSHVLCPERKQRRGRRRGWFWRRREFRGRFWWGRGRKLVRINVLTKFSSQIYLSR